MRLATLRHNGATIAARVDDGDVAVPIDPFPNVSELLQNRQWHDIAAAASGKPIPLSETTYAPVVPRPSKIICVGLNYANHITEMGRELPGYPTLFAKFAEALIGARDDIRVSESLAGQLDWEGELAVVVGRTARRVPCEDAGDYIAGYTVANDITARDYQYRTSQWLQGKTVEGTCPIGPVLVTADDSLLGGLLRTFVDGTVMQEATTDDLVFGPERLVHYISEIVTLQAGDVILTGTPGGVGHPTGRHLSDGQTVSVQIEGIGEVRNTVVVH
jgi:acylpyruvate hydrolase